MSKAKPVLLIVAAVIIAGGVAVYMSRDNNVTPKATAPQAGGGRIRGPENAPVTLVEFGDYQCPACGSYHPIIKEVLNRYPQQVKLEFQHFPLIQIHANAMAAALAAEAAGDQGKFWEMHDMLFERQDTWARSPNAEAEFVSMALQLGLNANQFQQSLRSPEVRDRVLAGVTKGTNANVLGTPTFFINGRQVDGSPGVDELSRLIEAQLQTVNP